MKEDKSLILAVIIVSVIAILSVSFLYSPFKKFGLIGYSITAQDTLLGVIGDRMPSNSFSTQFKIAKYYKGQWSEDSCYGSALEACKAIFPGTVYVRETTEIVNLSLWNFYTCNGGRFISSYIYKDYCYSKLNYTLTNASIDAINSLINATNATGKKRICERNYTVKDRHTCPCSSDKCSSGSITGCETQRSSILSWLLQQPMVKCREQCTSEKVSACNQNCQSGYTEVGVIDC